MLVNNKSITINFSTLSLCHVINLLTIISLTFNFSSFVIISLLLHFLQYFTSILSLSPPLYSTLATLPPSFSLLFLVCFSINLLFPFLVNAYFFHIPLSLSLSLSHFKLFFSILFPTLLPFPSTFPLSFISFSTH